MTKERYVMDDLKAKIIEHGKIGYCSKPHEFSDSDVDIIIKNGCQCCYCGKSIFEMWDFPEVLEDEKEVLCEECFDEHYRDICPICEDYYEIKSVKGENTPFPKSPFYWFNSITEKEWKEYRSVDGEYKPSGIYQAIKYPVFIAACGGLGDTWIQWDNIEFICTIEDFVREHFTDNGRKWDEYEEWIQDGRKCDKANFIGDCCWGTALSIQNNKN